MAEGKKKATMPVELAIMRKLAYRKKLEDLGLQHLGRGEKRKEPSSSLRWPTPRPQDPVGDFQFPAEKREDYLFCHTCKVPCSSYFNLKQHLNGRRHRSTMASPVLGERDHRGERRMWCEPCGIWCIDEWTFELHLRGKKHVAQLQAIEEKRWAR